MRIQLSLNISDENVVRACQVLKESRELNSLVVKMLTAYTYDQKDLTDVYNNTGTVTQEEKDYSSEYAEIRNSLMVMGVLLDDGQNLFDESTSTFSEYMEQATEKDVYEKETTDTGGIKITPKLLPSKAGLTERPRVDAHGEKQSDYFDPAVFKQEITNTVMNMRNDITEIKEFLHMPKGSQGTIGSEIEAIKTVVEERKVNAQEEKPAETVAEVPTDNIEPAEETKEFGVELESGVQFVAETGDDGVEVKSDEPVNGEASSAIDELLSSLF